MKRTQIYLTEEEQEKLDSLSNEKGVSRSAIIREAVDEYIAKHSAEHRKKVFERVAGLWKDRDDLPDFEEVRKEADERLERVWKDRS